MKYLRKRIIFNVVYFFLWIGYFIISKLIFILYYFNKSSEIEFSDFLKIFVNGFKLDASLTAYISLFPFLIILFSIWLPNKFTKDSILSYTYLLIFITTLLMIIDLNLYDFWGTRLDATAFIHIDTPSIMFASMESKKIAIGVIVWILLSLIFCYIFRKVIRSQVHSFEKGHYIYFPVLFLVFASLVIVMRGGFQEIPINQSNVYFSTKPFVNHASLNYTWNLLHSYTHGIHDKTNRFIEMDSHKATQLIHTQRQSLIGSSADSIRYPKLKNSRPNIILIIWESLTAKIVAPLGGEPSVTENLNNLSKEGILFRNFYANGDRSDKGLVSIFSGYYPQPDKSIIKIPSKAKSLPMLTDKMNKLGYYTSFYYGGDMNFGNLNTYILNGKVDKIIDSDSFSKKDWNSKWGVHDEVVKNKFISDINAMDKKPFFASWFTLTSHEPYEFPGIYKFGKNSEENKFRSSMAYTDKVVGDFIREAKQQSWWDNTLIIIVADHGHPYPKLKGVFNSPKRFKIPMIWIGGALENTGEENTNLTSQIDFSYTLLEMLGGDNSEFVWGNNLFKESTNHYIHYIFNKGFGTITENGTSVYDYVSKSSIFYDGSNPQKSLELGKALTQDAFQDYIER